MTLPITYFDPTQAMWPDLYTGRVMITPVRVGMNRFTGEIMIGWPHVQQSMALIFMTRFHERILRRWVGSFVPHLLGESAVPRIITRFFWAIASAIDLWEPCYRIKRVLIPPTVTDDTIRLGNWEFDVQGVYMPRALVGDFTPAEGKTSAFVGRGGVWEAGAPPPTGGPP
jgi:uncharacterized protein